MRDRRGRARPASGPGAPDAGFADATARQTGRRMAHDDAVRARRFVSRDRARPAGLEAETPGRVVVERAEPARLPLELSVPVLTAPSANA